MRGNYGDRGRGGFGQMSPPVKVGDELDVTIEAVGEKGDGIAKKDGFILFVPGVKEGETVRIRVTRVLRKVGFAEKVGDAEASPASAEAPAEAPVAETESFEAPIEAPAEDSESFGEEAPAEEPAEEPVPEAPAEETTEEEPSE